MRADRFGMELVRLNYRSPDLRDDRRRHVPLMITAIRFATAAVMLGALTIAVPCAIYTVVGLCTGSASTVDAAWATVRWGGIAAFAGVPAVACHWWAEGLHAERKPGVEWN